MGSCRVDRPEISKTELGLSARVSGNASSDAEFTEKVEQRLMYTDGLHETWLRVWRLFCLVDPVQDSEPVYAKKRLESRLVLDSDLERAVKLIAPALTLELLPRDAG